MRRDPATVPAGLRALYLLSAASVLSLVSACGEHSPPKPRPSGSGIDGTRAVAAVAAVKGRVETIRGLPFLRPVDVRAVGDDEARAYVIRRLEEFSPRERLDAEETAFVLLGLLPAGIDLEQQYLEVIEEQAGGFYDPGTGSFFLLEDMPAALAPALAAHELTHALEDQHYDLDARLRGAEHDDDLFLTRAAVHEGSATLVMTKIVADGVQNGATPVEELREFQESDAGRGEKLAALPPLLKRELLGVYFLGASFLLRGEPTATVVSGSYPAADVRRAYENGPTSSEQLLHPEKYWEPDSFDPPEWVETPKPGPLMGEGWSVVAEGILGEFALGAMTGAPTPETSASALARSSDWTNAAAAGWDGDRWALWRHEDGSEVAVLVTEWDTPDDATEFADAIGTPSPVRAWRRAGRRVVVAAARNEVDARPIADSILNLERGFGAP